MGIKFSGGFKPPTGQIKIKRSIPASFMNGITTKEFYHTPTAPNLVMDAAFSKWMAWDGTITAIQSYDHTVSAKLIMDEALSKWMITWIES